MIKKIFIIAMVTLFLLTTISCGNTKKINDVTYDTYGLINKDDKKNPNIKYRLIIGNIILSCLLVETIVAPIYFLGFSIYEPVRQANPNEPLGSI